MITFFTTYKNFKGPLEITQTNAIKSWRNLGPEVEILLFEKDTIAERLAKEVNAKYIPEIKRNETGTPYLSDIFTKAQEIAQYNICCYLNCDIILPENFLEIIRKVHSTFQKKYLVVGQRNDFDVNQLIDFSNKKEKTQFFEIARKESVVHSVTGIDFFVFPKSFYPKVPDLLVGRSGFDNWLIWKARRLGIVVDATESLMVIHQNHNFVHLDKKNTKDDIYSGKGDFNRLKLEGDEGKYNLQFMGKYNAKVLNVMDSTWKFSQGSLKKKNSKDEREFYLGRLWRIYPEYAFFIIKFMKIRRFVKKVFKP